MLATIAIPDAKVTGPAAFQVGVTMWADTSIKKTLGLAYPIIQGPFGGGVSSTQLVAAVSNAGGLGSFGANALSPAQITEVVADIRARTGKPFAINLWVMTEAEPALSAATFEKIAGWFAPYYRELALELPKPPARFAQDYAAQIEALLAARPPVASFVFGVPATDILQACREREIFTIGTATTVEEAEALEEAGLDAVVATGFEAGGHRPSFLRSAEASLTGTLALVPQVADRVKIPVIAAGAIADGRGVAAALALGAQAVQIGTAFLGCAESGAPAVHREMLFQPDVCDTQLTRVFSGRLVRAIRNRFMDDMSAHAVDLPPYPIQNWFSGSLRKAAIEQGRADFLSLQAGQGTRLLKEKTAQALMDKLVRETSAVLDAISR